MVELIVSSAAFVGEQRAPIEESIRGPYDIPDFSD